MLIIGSSYQENNYEINLPIENLFNKDDITMYKRLAQNGTLTENGAEINYTSSFIKVDANENYMRNIQSASAYRRICFYSSNNESSFISYVDTIGFTTPSNCKYVRFSGYLSELNTTQLEKGTKVNAYTPYGTNPIELCKTENYQDYIYKNNNNWYLHKEIGKKIVDKDTSITGYTTNVSGHYRYGINISDIKILTNGRAIPDLYCSHYKGQMVGNDGSWDAHQGIAIDNTHQRVYINDDTYYTQDATAYKTWIADNNLTIYYPLDTPTETQITDATLISQLNAWYNAQSMDGTTYITVDGNLPMQLKLKALKK